MSGTKPWQRPLAQLEHGRKGAFAQASGTEPSVIIPIDSIRTHAQQISFLCCMANHDWLSSRHDGHVAVLMHAILAETVANCDDMLNPFFHSAPMRPDC